MESAKDSTAGSKVAYEFSALPLALAVPGAIPLLPAVIVTQTVVELFASLIFMQIMPRVGHSDEPATQAA